MTCDCIAKADELLIARGLNSRVKQILVMRGNEWRDSGALVQTVVDVPKRGARPVTLEATFCPFCGVAYTRGDNPHGDNPDGDVARTDDSAKKEVSSDE